jgi:hypothetical protein
MNIVACFPVNSFAKKGNKKKLSGDQSEINFGKKQKTIVYN